MFAGKRSIAFEVSQSAMCAVLYAVGSYFTAYISSPWGFGQFRPAVVIPAVFATLFGPIVGGLGAALGTLIVDSAKYGQIYVRSLVSAVPGNLVGFYVFGWLMKRRFSWENFIKTSQVTLLIANAIVAFLYVYFRAFVEASYPVAFREAWVYVSLGLVAWWYVTMLPFVLLIGPPLIRAVTSAFPGLVSDKVRSSALKTELPRRSFALSMIAPGLFMLMIGIAITVVDSRLILASNLASSPLVLAGMQALFLGSGAILFIIGILVLATRRLTRDDKLVSHR